MRTPEGWRALREGDVSFPVGERGAHQFLNRTDAPVRLPVQLVPESADRTRIELEHRNLARHGEDWERTRGAVGGEGGWPGCLRRFAERLAA
jgi:uncharacterized cupin superfamily protein